MDKLTTSEIDRIVRSALAIRDQAYAPYSNFLVGAALLSSNDELFVGCNVENASYSLSICAERFAATSAVARGVTNWKAMAISSMGGVTPCGACRQFLAEFALGLDLFLVNSDDGKYRHCTVSDLLPDAFYAAQLPHHP